MTDYNYGGKGMTPIPEGYKPTPTKVKQAIEHSLKEMWSDPFVLKLAKQIKPLGRTAKGFYGDLPESGRTPKRTAPIEDAEELES